MNTDDRADLLYAPPSKLLFKKETEKILGCVFDVLNEVQQALFIDRHSNKSGLTASTDLGGQALKRYRDTPHYLSAISILREADTDDNVLKNCSVLAGLDSYRSLLDETRHLDYSAIIEAAVEVLSCDAPLKERIAARVKHVVVTRSIVREGHELIPILLQPGSGIGDVEIPPFDHGNDEGDVAEPERHGDASHGAERDGQPAGRALASLLCNSRGDRPATPRAGRRGSASPAGRVVRRSAASAV